MESSNTLEDSENMNKQGCLIEYKSVLGTPFTIVRKEGIKFGVMGKHQITETTENEEELEEELKKITWNRLIQVIMILKENEVK